MLGVLPNCMDAASPRLDAAASWIGNQYPGAKRWVPQDIDALCVAPDGTLFSNVHWEEGRRNVTAFKEGEDLIVPVEAVNLYYL